MTDAILTETPATSPQSDRLDRAKAFIEALKQLDKGRLAILRRNSGNTLSEARGASWFYGTVAGFASEQRQELYFLVATLFAFDKEAQEKGSPELDFGATMNRLRTKSASPDGLDRRFSILLDADYDPHSGGELAFRLRQTVKQVISKKDPAVRISWPHLLVDLNGWNYDRKPVQKKWARSYWTPGSANNNEEEGKDNAD